MASTRVERNKKLIIKIIQMKKNKIIFWITTSIIILMEGVIPALTSQSEMAKQGISHLGYPLYFGNVLVAFKILGAIALMLPMISVRIKEWVYAGFMCNFIFASVSYLAVDGFGMLALFPVVFMIILGVSYVMYHRLRTTRNSSL
jgi:hypothetical protein